jgi:hypothetical protein
MYDLSGDLWFFATGLRITRWPAGGKRGAEEYSVGNGLCEPFVFPVRNEKFVLIWAKQCNSYQYSLLKVELD